MNERAVEFRARDGVVLRGDAWGEEGAAPVLLLHGGGQTRHSWSRTARALAEVGWCAISLDLRGHGDSDWSPDGVYGGDVFVRDLEDVARVLSHPPVVVGASLGGMAALMAEGEAPEPLTSAVVLVDVTPRLELDGVIRIIEFMTSRPDGFESLAEAADAVAAYTPQRRRPRDLSGLKRNLRQGQDGRWRWHWDPRFIEGSKAVREGVRSPKIYDSDRMVRAAAALRVPTLLVRGKVSDVVSEQGVQEFLEAAPHARFVDVSDAGHMVAGDRNDVFTDAVVSFLADVHPRSSAPRPSST